MGRFSRGGPTFPIMLPYKQLQVLNDLLGSELGRTPYGEPHYKWAWSEDLTHYRRMENMAYVQVPGSPIILAEPTYEMVKLCPSLHRQYVILHWSQPISQDAWLAEFGSKLQWPARGEYYPTNMCLGYEEHPDIDVTWDAIGKVKAERNKTFADHIAADDAALARVEKANNDLVLDDLKDTLTAFGNIPGKRSGGVSFGGI